MSSICMRTLAAADRSVFCEVRRNYQKRLRTFPKKLTPVPQSEWPKIELKATPSETWASHDFLVQVFKSEGKPTRLSISRTELANDGNWKDGITWDEMQKIKAEVGFPDQWAVEIYPPDEHVVNVANIRHLWIVPAPDFAWRKEAQ